VFAITATSWIPFGASQRGARTTWIDLVEFCRSNVKGIIFLDEVDKLMGWSPWMQFIRTEAFALLDCKVPDTVALSGTDTCEDDPDELKGRVETGRIRLADSFLILGAGAFQAIWQGKAASPIGFGSQGPSPSAPLEKAELGNVIPPEIINRFASPLLVLHPLLAMDYQSILAWSREGYTTRTILAAGAAVRSPTRDPISCEPSGDSGVITVTGIPSC
jgi:hypothetical protein